jgi:predicted neuraminidase
MIAMVFAAPAIAEPAVVLREWLYETAPFPECHASTLAETKSGLVAAWFGGTYEKHPDVGIWFARRSEEGWTQPREIFNGTVDGGQRFPCWNPVLFDAKENGLLLFYKVGPSPESWWGMLSVSRDDGASWEAARRLPDGILGPIKNKPILLADGKLLCGSSSEHDGWKVHMESTGDWGKTWSRTGPLELNRLRGAIQPTILAYRDGASSRLQILCRSRGDGVILQSWSRDHGSTWSALTAAALPNPNSGIDGVTLRDGRQLLVYNHTARGRSPINVAVSSNGGDWSAAAVLETDPGEFSYPAVIQSSDDRVHITYTWKRERIRHLVLELDKISLKPIVSGQWPDR